MNWPILTVELAQERDAVTARQWARQIAALLKFDEQDQTRIATAVSEIARNAWHYGGGGQVEFALQDGVRQSLTACIVDRGPGIDCVDDVLHGGDPSPASMGLGLAGSRRLMDRFEIENRPGAGCRVTIGKLLPNHVPRRTPDDIEQLARTLAASRPKELTQELRDQNLELLRAFDELRRRQDEMEILNQELEDTNRGVVALYSELDEQAARLQRVDQVKTRFFSNMSHELRTPLNSIQALAQWMLGEVDGPLTDEQRKQVTLIHKAAQELTELVNDLLDLAKVEAGKTVVRAEDCDAESLLGALRGMFRPLAVNPAVQLIFEDARGIPPLLTDEAKLGQILRNFISNALKFTEQGEVRVRALHLPQTDRVRFEVSDTGIGIDPEDQDRVFQEFAQIEHTLQRKVKGSGLGLPLSRKLSELLGGTTMVSSQLGVGSTFAVEVPRIYAIPAKQPDSPSAGSRDRPVLFIEDRDDLLVLYQRFLRNTSFRLTTAGTPDDAERAMTADPPQAIVLASRIHEQETWGFLRRLKEDPRTAEIPVVVAGEEGDETQALGAGADSFACKPLTQDWLLAELEGFANQQRRQRVLVVDGDAAERSAVRAMLSGLAFLILEAGDAATGLQYARHFRPDAVILELELPDMPGQAMLTQLPLATLPSLQIVLRTSQPPAEVWQGPLAELTGSLSGARSVLDPSSNGAPGEGDPTQFAPESRNRLGAATLSRLRIAVLSKDVAWAQAQEELIAALPTAAIARGTAHAI